MAYQGIPAITSETIELACGVAFEWNKFIRINSFRQWYYAKVLSFQHALVVCKLHMTANEAWSSFVVAQLKTHYVLKNISHHDFRVPF